MSTKTNTITLDRSAAKWLAEVGLSASSAEDVTPVICAAYIEVDGEQARVTCTDRYRMHTALVKLEQPHKPYAFLLPREALTWLNKNAAYHGRFMAQFNRVTITTHTVESISGGKVTIVVKKSDENDALSVSWSGELVMGKFPPVLDLIKKARDAEVGSPARVKLDWFAKARILGSANFSPVIKFTDSGEAEKPGPVYLSWTDFDGQLYAEALIQPNRLNQ